MNEFANTILSSLIQLICALLVALLCAAVRYLISWIKAKTDNQMLKNALDELQDAVMTGIWFFEQTTVKQLKENGTWNNETQKQVLDECVKYVINRLSEGTAEYLGQNEIELTEQVRAEIEANLGKQHYFYSDTP